MRFFGARRTSGSGPANGRPDELGDDELQARVEGLLMQHVGDPDHGDPLDPLTRDRVTAWLERSGFSYFVDSDGDVGGLWHGWLFYFLVLGEHSDVLQVRGQWHRDLTIERLEDVLELCNEWNAERIWPKTYARVRDDGTIVVCAEVTADIGGGVTDDQLDQLLQCGLSTGSMFFQHLDTTFPDPLREAS
ncbi:YbjN domain-containing protein [Isoptericola sp. NEAU-Y5]|uniref:YbjN domain-containing protein n=1 Tax=Isoptericola luteus TaxID=2879484 RepID=A0ABS7ZFA6_9MICO|nr:YbjN domain-containing protein [Isoptericola sp. NEAU-Y5]MCA5893182.1 YbjN domain-containing protein [Isoptericola sp. NEAU-Y5]